MLFLNFLHLFLIQMTLTCIIDFIEFSYTKLSIPLSSYLQNTAVLKKNEFENKVELKINMGTCFKSFIKPTL